MNETLRDIGPCSVTESMNGQLYTWRRPASPYARAASVLGALLLRAFDEGEGGPGGWWIVDQPELHFGRDVLVPDIAGWRREDTPEYPDTSGSQITPDWVCEVITPKTVRVDRVEKLQIYARRCVADVWLVEPDMHTIEVLRLSEGKWTAFYVGGDDVVRAEPFDAVELPLAKLWLTPPSPQS